MHAPEGEMNTKENTEEPLPKPKPKCCCEGRMDFCLCLAKGVHGDGSGAIFDFANGKEIQLSSARNTEESK